MKCSDAALFSDLDGTLFNCRGEVSINNRNAIEDFIAQGGMFGIATGRASQNALQHLPGISINAPSIVFNGAAIEISLFDFCNPADAMGSIYDHIVYLIHAPSSFPL